MILNIGLRGSIADDYARSDFSNAHDFIIFIKHIKPISRIWKGDVLLFCYTSEQAQEIPDAIPYIQGQCN